MHIVIYSIPLTILLELTDFLLAKFMYSVINMYYVWNLVQFTLFYINEIQLNIDEFCKDLWPLI